MSPITPPCGCCIFLLLPSTTTIPLAITAPDSFATLPHAKMTSAITAERAMPMASGRRSSAVSDGVIVAPLCFERLRTTTEAVILEIAPAQLSTYSGPNRMEQHLLQHLLLRTE